MTNPVTAETERNIMKIRITFTEDLLATLPGDKELAKNFVAAKNPDGMADDELTVIDSMSEALEKATMHFARDVDKAKPDYHPPFLYDYQVKGFFKGACLAFIESDNFTREELKKLRLTPWTYKRTIGSQIHIGPRKIFFDCPDGTDQDKLDFCERPLRADTMKGERIALARSEAMPAGTSIVVEITTLNLKLIPFVKAWLSFGGLIGLGGWRGSGKGRFTVEYLEQNEIEAKTKPAKPSPKKKDADDAKE